MDIITVAPTAGGDLALGFVWAGVAAMCLLAIYGIAYLDFLGAKFLVQCALILGALLAVGGAVFMSIDAFESWHDELAENRERADAEWIEQIDETYGIEVARGQLSDLDVPTKEPTQPTEYGSTDVWLDEQLTAVTLTWTGDEFVLVDDSDELVPESLT